MSQQSHVLLDRLDGRLSGEIDMATAPAAETDFLALALRTTGPTITIDCTGLTFIDSAGVRMLEHVAKRSGKSVQLTNPPHTCRRILEILDLCEEFGIQPTAPLAAGPVASPWRFPSRGPAVPSLPYRRCMVKPYPECRGDLVECELEAEMGSAPIRYNCPECELRFDSDASGLLTEAD